MFKILTLLLFSSLYIFAANPLLYKPIGDPLYKEIPAVISLSKMSYFKKDKPLLLEFIMKAQKHKKLGYQYDKKKKQNTLSKSEQKSYLTGLRHLKKSLRQIYSIIQTDLLHLIKINYTKTFNRLLKTKLDIFYLDPKMAKAIKDYKYKLNKRKRIAKQKKAQKDKKAKKAYYKFLRSPKNLTGKWEGRNNEKEVMFASFHKDIVYLTYKSKGQIQTFKGIYKIVNNKFSFLIQQRKRTKKDISHIKKVNYKRLYIITKISKTKLHLKYKDETIYLKKRVK